VAGVVDGCFVGVLVAGGAVVGAGGAVGAVSDGASVGLFGA
jgi:hypothetical protein